MAKLKIILLLGLGLFTHPGCKKEDRVSHSEAIKSGPINRYVLLDEKAYMVANEAIYCLSDTFFQSDEPIRAAQVDSLTQTLIVMTDNRLIALDIKTREFRGDYSSGGRYFKLKVHKGKVLVISDNPYSHISLLELPNLDAKSAKVKIYPQVVLDISMNSKFCAVLTSGQLQILDHTFQTIKNLDVDEAVMMAMNENYMAVKEKDGIKAFQIINDDLIENGYYDN